MSTYPASPKLPARPCSSCSDGETTPGSQTRPELTSRVVRRLREQLEQAEAELEANKHVVRDSKLAKLREQLLSFHSLESGIVLMNVPEGRSASAKEVQFIKADHEKVIAQYEQTIQAMSMTAKSQQTQKRQAHKDLLKLREGLASSSGMSSSAQSLADVKISSLVQEVSGISRGAGRCTALLQEAQSDNATLASDLGDAHRECTELDSKLSLQIYYVQRDLEKAEREGDAARRSLRDSKEAHVQALRAQSAAFDQALDDAKTTAAQDILKFAAAMEESQHKESKAAQNLQWCQLDLHNQTAALRGEVVEYRVKHMQCAQRLEDAEEELEQVHEATAKLEQQVSSLTAALEASKQRECLTAHKLSQREQQLQTEIAALHVNVHEANSRASGAETSLADAQAKEQDLVEKLACKHANQEKLQAQVCSLASQLNAALAASHQGTGSQLGQLQKEVLGLTHKLAKQQSKMAQAEAGATLMQIRAHLTQKVCDVSPRPASLLLAFSPHSPLAPVNSTSGAASLFSDESTHVTFSEPLAAHALGSLSPLSPVSPAVGLSTAALMALSGKSQRSPLVLPSAPALRALPSVSPASSALPTNAPALRALSSLSLADGSVLQSGPAQRAPSSLSSEGAVPGSPEVRRAFSSVGERTGLKTPPSVALDHMPSPPQTEATPPSFSFTPAEPQLLSDSAARDLVQLLELVLPDLTSPPPLPQSDALTDSTDQTHAYGQTAASAGLLLTGGASSRLRRSPGPATSSPRPARLVLSSSPAASSATLQPRMPVRQTKKHQAMMDCLAKKLVTTMPGSSGSVSLKTAVHSPEGVSVHSTSLQRKSRMSVSKAGGRSPFGDMTNNINVTPNRSPRLLQDDSKSRAGSRDPYQPPKLDREDLRDLDTVGMLCGSPANPSSISRNAMESAAQSTAPSGASLSCALGLCLASQQLQAAAPGLHAQQGIRLQSMEDGAHLFTEANDDRGFSSFCEGYILDEGSGFVQEVSLLIGINISVKSPRKGKDQQTNLSPGLNHRSKPSLNCRVNCSFNEHYNDAALSDVTLKAGDCQVHAHRIVLAARSPWFKAMFQSGMREESMGTIELGDMQGPVLEAMMEYLYGCLT
ncbi:hypothetical protein WJX82_005996 [Trebouxia sp. C0006]